jgi:MFS family permease
LTFSQTEKEKQIKNDTSRYKWYVLVLAALTHTFAVAMPTMCMPVLFEEISKDLELTLVQIGAVWGMSSLTGIFPSLIGGTLGDRYGTRRTLVASCLLAGSAGILRGFSADFTTLSATFLLYGLFSPAITMNIHKVCGLWFSKQRSSDTAGESLKWGWHLSK